ncbi:MAG: hypothetical protein AAF662_02745 [Pseudomonadota bacterium]
MSNTPSPSNPSANRGIGLIKRARTKAADAIRDLKRLDRVLTKLGCVNAHIHYKGRKIDGQTVPTNQMYLLGAQDKVTKKRPYTYIGVDEDKQREAAESISRYKIRETLRARISELKSTMRKADLQLHKSLATYRELAQQAVASVREYKKHAGEA